MNAYWILFLIGLRHGLDPDHLAVVDNFSWRARLTPSRFTPWIGTVFALGHGLTITIAMALIVPFARTWSYPPLLQQTLSLIPALLLLSIAVLNWRQLHSTHSAPRRGLFASWLPKWFTSSCHPATVFSCGVLFALVMDLFTQVVAWSTLFATRLTISQAMIAGLMFTAGMMLTDTIDSTITYQLGRYSMRAQQRYRRMVGYLIVVGSAITGLYLLGETLFHLPLPSETTRTALGSILIVITVALWWRFCSKGSTNVSKTS